ncbi:hypothetical protein AMATHDRAFT_71794 [Amanita thiersii Skay4041]|uniref:G-alpha-domain-containing protein n=1 Tax=Amanita thiersii Skay4041 TaxID=703135 RepID=A0A2A9N6L2_9AGAR|nr:hypothetical protein AMATHDRAFT_71794 [Amanita thiersii Skay4041]
MLKSKHPQSRRRSISDPLAVVLRPPPNESPEDRESRLKAESDARKVSNEIDEMLRQERMDKKRMRADVSVLLLGQSESGKSTTLKQFQLLHSPASFHAERLAWRAVIYLNLVRSVRRILDSLSPESDALDEVDDSESLETASIIISANGRPPSAISGTRVPNFELYRRRLEPLILLEDRLTQLFSPNGEAQAEINISHASSGHYTAKATATRRSISRTSNAEKHTSRRGSPNSDTGEREVSVHTSRNWKQAFSMVLVNRAKNKPSGEIEGWWTDPDDPSHTLHACAPTMLELWRDPAVRQRLREKGIFLEDTSGFYLDEIPRITAKRYIPTDADVLKARLKTLGVVEHSFSVQSRRNRAPVQWKIYDVGGSRNQRQAWAPYFEDVNAIIFLAPISAFDQFLEEDPRVNRLDDSLQLWRSVVSNRLLSHVSFVLFLNKCDLLQAKLDAGVKVKQHILSYGNRPNAYDSVSKFFRDKFSAIHQSHTPNRERGLYSHFTSVTDTRATAKIITSIQDIIVRINLTNMKLV